MLAALGEAHWLIVSTGLVAGHLPAPDPRYVLLSVPVSAGATVVVISAIPHRRMHLASIGLCAILLGVSCAIQLPRFPGMDYVIVPERAAGECLGAAAPAEGSLWVDAPVAIYYSGLPLERFV